MASAPRHLRIFLASPGDVVDEREIALRVLDDLPYDPLLRGRITIEEVAWDKQGAGAPILAGVTPQDSIAAGLPKPSDCDIVVVIFWSRFGTRLPAQYQKADESRYESGTEWEYEDAVTAFRTRGAPYVLLYRRNQTVRIDLDHPYVDEQRAQYEKVKRFFGALRNTDGSAKGGYTEYDIPGDFRDILEHDLKSLIARILEKPHTVHTPPVALPQPWKGSPFPGLRAFTVADAPIFFGREREIDALAARVQEYPLVAVVGASGSGKSSLVAAGVIPRLQLTAGSVGMPEWRTLHFTPDRLGAGDPFTSLAAAVLNAFPQSQQKGLAAKLRTDHAMLLNIMSGVRSIIFIDQFEELFTTVKLPLRVPFIHLLEQLCNDHRTRIIITVRADFYGKCVEMQSFTRLIENSTFPLAAPGVAALYRMITRPAARAELAFDDQLAQRILDDTGQEPGALALMAYTLDELYRRGLNHAAYEQLGGVQGAIGKRAEAVFATLEEEDKAALPRVFSELVEVSERGTATRQRAPFARVAATPAMKRLTDALTEARLLVPTRGETNEPVVEVAHEALFRNWPRLADWIGEAQDNLRLIRQVRTASTEWDRSGRRDHFLWPHERLQPVYTLLERTGVSLDPISESFIRPEYDRIIDLMRAEPTEVRRRALIERLAEIGPDGARSLVECLQYARTLAARVEIYDALVSLGDVAVAPLLDAAVDSKVVGRQYVVDALTRVGPRMAAHLVPSLLNDNDVGVRSSAVILAAYTQMTNVIPTLCRALRDPVENVRSAALYALATFNSIEALNGLLSVIETHSSYLQVIAIELLGLLSGQVSVDQPQHSRYRGAEHAHLARLIHENMILRDAAVATRVMNLLAPLRRHNNSVVAFAASDVLELLVSPKMIKEVLSRSRVDAEIDVLLSAIVNVNHEMVDLVSDLMDQSEPRLRLRAARAIGTFAGQFATQESLDKDQLRIREAVRGPRVVSRLNELRLGDEDAGVRDAADQALAQIGRMPHHW